MVMPNAEAAFPNIRIRSAWGEKLDKKVADIHLSGRRWIFDGAWDYGPCNQGGYFKLKKGEVGRFRYFVNGDPS
jgi:hypothetical protein